jgi:hypothetical protein
VFIAARLGDRSQSLFCNTEKVMRVCGSANGINCNTQVSIRAIFKSYWEA